LLHWLELPREGVRGDLLLAPIAEAGRDQSATYKYVQGLHREQRSNEDSRLLYVAATRARKRLHLLGHTRTDEQGQAREPSRNSLLAKLWPAVEEDFRKGLDEQVPEEGAGRDTADGTGAHCIHRVRGDWVPPEPPADVTLPGAPEAPPEPGDGDEDPDALFDWAGETIRRVGTVVHEYLRIIAQEGLDAWSGERLAREGERIKRKLRLHGVGRDELEDAAGSVASALANTLESAIGCWILAPRPGARCEYALTGALGGETVSVVMDRTFVDEDGTRWIVDYKTGIHEGGDRQAFLERETLRYRGQMARYARLMRSMEDRPVRVGLFFPLIGGWRYWDPGV
jgi:ATP-dependent exoDNAse (exonuclease V) beta subunit